MLSTRRATRSILPGMPGTSRTSGISRTSRTSLMPLAMATIFAFCGVAGGQSGASKDGRAAPTSPSVVAAGHAGHAGQAGHASRAGHASHELPAWLANATFYTPPSDRNAALAYYQSFTMLPRDARGKSGNVDWDAVGTNVDGAKMPETFTQAARALSEDYLNRVMMASRMSVCRWESSFEDGILMLLPYLGDLRATARSMRVGARLAMVEGRPSLAAERLVAMHRMAAHGANDPVLICSLVGIAISELANEETRLLAESGQLTAGSRDIIIKHIESLLDEKDLMNSRAAIVGERDLMLGWIEATYMREGGAAELAADLQPGEGGAAPDLNNLTIKSLSTEQLKDAIAQSRRFFDQALAVWDMTDAPERLTSLSELAAKDEFGPLTKVLLPSLARAKRSSIQHRESLRETLAVLRNAKVRDEEK